MNDYFSINTHIVHLWSVVLSEFSSHDQNLTKLLSEDEAKRSNRFHFPLHRERYLITRGLLRKTLSLYTGVPPERIVFSYGPQGKPFLGNNPSKLAFNVSHSHDMAVFALTIDNAIGVDIEKMEPRDKENLAKRFFSHDEYVQLMEFSINAQPFAFYRLWTCKEAVIKAEGTGLFSELSHFSVSLKDDPASVVLHHHEVKKQYYVKNILIDPGYQSALATLKSINKIIRFKWTLEDNLSVPSRETE